MPNNLETLEKALELSDLKGVHPVANIPPWMSEEEYDELVKSVKEDGFLNPIKVTKDQMLIDGRNRLCASFDTGKKVAIEELNPFEKVHCF
jgi:ParB-like chromosome segregation protein Spo0J